MVSTFGGLETAKSGLSAARTNIDITGHNISNANTVGYTRQRLITSSREPGQGKYLISQFYHKKIGQGVDMLQVQQLRSQYLDQQYRDVNTNFSYSESRVQGLTYMSGLLNELNVESGLTTSIENYFASLNKLTEDPSSIEYRTNVQQQALSMTQNFNNVYQEMTDLWHDQNDSISVVAQRINSISGKLVSLNESIASYERSGQAANDLRDDRNLLLDELSGLVNITYSTNEVNSSMVDVKIGGVSLVTGTSSYQIEVGKTDTPSDGGTLEDFINNNRNILTIGNEELSIENGTLTGGQLYAHMEMISLTGTKSAGIPYYMDQLSQLARNMAESINDIHSTGFSHAKGTNGSVDGINFFDVPKDKDNNTDYSLLTAGNFTISSEVLSNAFNIAASSVKVDLSTGSTETGNNNIALNMFKDLSNKDYYGQLNSIVGHLAIGLDASQSVLDTRQSLMNSVDSQRTSISGVSLDEETTNLIVFQQSYNACARVVTTIDDMLDTLINNMGRVGR